MKKVLVILVAFSWHSGVVADTTLPVLAQELDVLIAELNDLSDDFVDGQLLTDASEKKMNLVVLPFFNWFSGISTTNKKNPASLTSDQIAEYNRLFIKYTKVYGSDDELYDYYNFGKTFLTLVNAVNILKGDLSVLGIRDVNEVAASKLSQSILAHATAYMAALSLYTDFSKTAQKGFRKPFSVSLGDTYTEFTAFAQKVISFKDQIDLPSAPQPPVVSLKTAPELAMDALVGSLYKGLLGTDSTDGMDPDKLTSDQVSDYTAQFALYEKQNGAAGKQYLYYKFGSLFLPLLLAKNGLEKDLIGMNSGDSEDIQYSDVTSAIKKDAQSFLDAYELFKAFIKVPSASVWPVSADIYKGYEEFVPYAKTIVSLKPPIVPIIVPPIVLPVTPPVNPPIVLPVTPPVNLPIVLPVTPPVNPPVVLPVNPPVAKGPAHSFILKNFGDSNISSLSADAMQSLLTAFGKTYELSDDFYSEYQMWAAYVPTRYWELQLLAGVTGAANAFSLTYLNNFKPVYAKNSNSLSDPYAAQLAAMALEFSVAYAIARAEIHEINNNLYA